MTTTDFATFCHRGDAAQLHSPGQLKKQVVSNGHPFNQVLVIHQLCTPFDFENSLFDDIEDGMFGYLSIIISHDLDSVLLRFGIDINNPQYVSDVDKAHTWKNHVANHLEAVSQSMADYIVFADSDCWMIKQPDSWVTRGIAILESQPDVFIVSPNDGEPERKTQVISQQMFMARVEDFRRADFNQPGYSGNPRDYPEMPEYHAMLEGRIHYYCKAAGRYRYVLGPEYRYFHHNRTNEDGSYKMNYSDYGIVI